MSDRLHRQQFQRRLVCPAVSNVRRGGGIAASRDCRFTCEVVLPVGGHGTHPTARGAGRAFESPGENFMDLDNASDDRVARGRDEACEGSGR